MSYIPLKLHQKDLLINIGSILTVCFQVGSKWSNYPSYIQYIFVDALQNTIQIIARLENLATLYANEEMYQEKSNGIYEGKEVAKLSGG